MVLIFGSKAPWKSLALQGKTEACRGPVGGRTDLGFFAWEAHTLSRMLCLGEKPSWRSVECRPSTYIKFMLPKAMRWMLVDIEAHGSSGYPRSPDGLLHGPQSWVTVGCDLAGQAWLLGAPKGGALLCWALILLFWFWVVCPSWSLSLRLSLWFIW